MENTTGAGTEQRAAEDGDGIGAARVGEARERPAGRRSAHEIEVLLPRGNGVGVERRRVLLDVQEVRLDVGGLLALKEPDLDLVQRGRGEVELVAEVVLGDLAPVDLPGPGGGDRDRHAAQRGGEGEERCCAQGSGAATVVFVDAPRRLRGRPSTARPTPGAVPCVKSIRYWVRRRLDVVGGRHERGRAAERQMGQHHVVVAARLAACGTLRSSTDSSASNVPSASLSSSVAWVMLPIFRNATLSIEPPGGRAGPA